MSRINATINTNRGWGVSCSVEDYDRIYNVVMKLTDNDHEISSEAASWCELATVGEIYEFRNGTIKIVELP